MGGDFRLCGQGEVDPCLDNAKHWRGAEPKRCRWQMKRGGSLVSKGVCRTAEKADDYCEPDRTNEVK